MKVLKEMEAFKIFVTKTSLRIPGVAKTEKDSVLYVCLSSSYQENRASLNYVAEKCGKGFRIKSMLTADRASELIAEGRKMFELTGECMLTDECVERLLRVKPLLVVDGAKPEDLNLYWSAPRFSLGEFVKTKVAYNDQGLLIDLSEHDLSWSKLVDQAENEKTIVDTKPELTPVSKSNVEAVVSTKETVSLGAIPKGTTLPKVSVPPAAPLPVIAEVEVKAEVTNVATAAVPGLSIAQLIETKVPASVWERLASTADVCLVKYFYSIFLELNENFATLEKFGASMALCCAYDLDVNDEKMFMSKGAYVIKRSTDQTLVLLKIDMIDAMFVCFNAELKTRVLSTASAVLDVLQDDEAFLPSVTLSSSKKGVYVRLR